MSVCELLLKLILLDTAFAPLIMEIFPIFRARSWNMFDSFTGISSIIEL